MTIRLLYGNQLTDMPKVLPIPIKDEQLYIVIEHDDVLLGAIREYLSRDDLVGSGLDVGVKEGKDHDDCCDNKNT